MTLQTTPLLDTRWEANRQTTNAQKHVQQNLIEVKAQHVGLKSRVRWQLRPFVDHFGISMISIWEIENHTERLLSAKFGMFKCVAYVADAIIPLPALFFFFLLFQFCFSFFLFSRSSVEGEKRKKKQKVRGRCPILLVVLYRVSVL